METEPVDDMTEPALSQSQLVTRLNAEAEFLHRRGRSLSEIRSGIINAGIHSDDADQMIETLSEYLQDKQGEVGRRNIFYGSLWLLGALGSGAAIFTARLSLGAWLAAMCGGGLGLTLLVRGVMQVRRDQPGPSEKP